MSTHNTSPPQSPSESAGTAVPVFRSPPSGDLSTMSTFDLAIDFIVDPVTCSDEVVNLLKERLSVTGRKITSLRPDSANLVGMDPSFVGVISADTATTRDAVTILASPPSKGYWSSHPFWHTYDVSADGSVRHYVPFG